MANLISQQQAHSILTPTSGFLKRCHFDYSLNPASGCLYGCSYCYAAAFTQQRAPEQKAWGEWTTFKSNAGKLIEEIPTGNLCGKWIYFASTTDPYQPQENEQKVSRNILEALANHHPGVHLVLLASQLGDCGIHGVVIQPFHSPQKGREHVAGTREGALNILTDRQIRDQANALYLKLKTAGIKVGTNEKGFDAYFFA